MTQPKQLSEDVFEQLNSQYIQNRAQDSLMNTAKKSFKLTERSKSSIANFYALKMKKSKMNISRRKKSKSPT